VGKGKAKSTGDYSLDGDVFPYFASWLSDAEKTVWERIDATDKKSATAKFQQTHPLVERFFIHEGTIAMYWRPSKAPERKWKWHSFTGLWRLNGSSPVPIQDDVKSMKWSRDYYLKHPYAMIILGAWHEQQLGPPEFMYRVYRNFAEIIDEV
jgi:hypothetical protein